MRPLRTYRPVRWNPAERGAYAGNNGRSNDSDKVIIATQFGGMWKTSDGGENWRHVRSLQAVFVKDVQYAPDGNTVLATLDRDNQSTNGGGIYVSRDAGSS